ncbi:hypothetical protein HPB50_020887 [Hyalomma asiaticum]|uniref:Uncharacterized protein n=1 Tax=Hyalomma asiaticum TaxID=266040 RepID=A0ACB7T8Y4_HYAAI|nr:hypothetical protein HPB50_020887 [Hyalomma asiaticum]
MGLPQLTDSDIVSIHRLRAVRDKAPGIIVHFAKQSVREEFLSKRHVLKESKQQCYILENLTKANRILLGQTKAWAKDHGYSFRREVSGGIAITGPRVMEQPENSDRVYPKVNGLEAWTCSNGANTWEQTKHCAVQQQPLLPHM